MTDTDYLYKLAFMPHEEIACFMINAMIGLNMRPVHYMIRYLVYYPSHGLARQSKQSEDYLAYIQIL